MYIYYGYMFCFEKVFFSNISHVNKNIVFLNNPLSNSFLLIRNPNNIYYEIVETKKSKVSVLSLNVFHGTIPFVLKQIN